MQARPSREPEGKPLMVLVRDISVILEDAGIEYADIDALAIIGHAAGMDPSEVRTAAARGDNVPAALDLSTLGDPAAPYGSLGDMVARRAQRIPLQHIVRGAPFRHLALEVGPGVFIPRPETEVVAQAAIDAVTYHADAGEHPVHVADLCSGSGAIGIAIGTEMGNATVTMVEVDAAAVAFLERNVAKYADVLGERVVVINGDARAAIQDREEAYHVVVANPPYIPPGAVPRDPEVHAHDPEIALYGGGEDGLEIPRGIVETAMRVLKRGGQFIMEHGDVQAAAVRGLLAETGKFTSVGTGLDLNGRERYVYGTRI